MLLSISDVCRIQVKRIVSTWRELVTTLVMYGSHLDHDIGHKHSPALELGCLVFPTSAGSMRGISLAPREKSRPSSLVSDPRYWTKAFTCAGARIMLLSISNVHRIYVKHIVSTWSEASVATPRLMHAIQSIIIATYTHLLRDLSHASPYSCLAEKPKPCSRL